MSLPLLMLYGIIPLAVFVLVDLVAGVRWAIGAAVAGGVLDVALTRITTGEWDPGSFVALGLIAALGAASVKLDNSLYFKLQPAVMALLFAGILAYFQVFGPPLMDRYAPLLRAGLPPNYQEQMDQPEFRDLMNGTLVWLIGFFIAYAGVMAVVARRCSNLVWLLMRGVGFWVLFVGLMLARMLVFFAQGGLVGGR